MQAAVDGYALDFASVWYYERFLSRPRQGRSPARRAGTYSIYIRGHPPHVPLSLLPLNRRFKRGTTVMLQAFRTWRTCSRHQH